MFRHALAPEKHSDIGGGNTRRTIDLYCIHDVYLSAEFEILRKDRRSRHSFGFRSTYRESANKEYRQCHKRQKSHKQSLFHKFNSFQNMFSLWSKLAWLIDIPFAFIG